MAEITYLEAIREALFEEMERDQNVFCLGEDIGAYGGAFKVTEGLLAKFGEQRVIDTPISRDRRSSARRRARRTWGCGRSCEMQFIDFISCAYDMLTNYVATARYRAFLPCPMVVRGPSGGYVRGGPFHSQNPEAAFLHTPGLKIVYPATASDAKGLMKAAIRDDDCVLFFEHKYLYRRIKEEMPAGDHVVPIGKARVAREGTDLSIITYAATVWKALEAAEQLEKEDGLSVEVHRPALAAADGRRGDRRDGEEDEPRADRARGHAHRRHRRRDHGADQRASLRVARRAGAARDGARRAAAVRAAARGLRAAADGGHRARRRGGWRRTDVADRRRETEPSGSDRRSALRWGRLPDGGRRVLRRRDDRRARSRRSSAASTGCAPTPRLARRATGATYCECRRADRR